MRRLQRPLNPQAVKAANKAVEAETGGRPIRADEWALRKKWVDAYLAAGGKEARGTNSRPVKSPVQPCAKKLASLDVKVMYTPYPSPVKGATVELIGPTPKTAITAASGLVKFTDLEPGAYEIKVSYTKKHPVVDKALESVGNTTWAVNADRSPYPSGANKCNLFVYEMARAAEYDVPQRTRWSWSKLSNVWYPPLAGEWANNSQSVGSWAPVTEGEAEPGDMVAESVSYSNATGHVGVVSYPKPNSKTKTLSEGEHANDEVTMERQVISAGSDEILNNDYFWSSRRHGVPYYKHYSK